MTNNHVIFRAAKVVVVPIILILALYVLYELTPAPDVPELIGPNNESYIEIVPRTQLWWGGGINDSLLSKIISVVKREPLGTTKITYNIYVGEYGKPLVLEKDITNLRAKANSKEQMYCSLPNYIKENSSYCWQVIAVSDLGKETAGPIWMFNTTVINSPPSLIDLTAEPSSPQAPGAIITWTANASDPNNDPIYYKFLLNGIKHTKEWTENNKWNWVTLDVDSGTNYITVLIKDEKHANGNDFDSRTNYIAESSSKRTYENSSDDWRTEKFVITTKHKILDIQSSSDFLITNIWDKNSAPLIKNDEFFYSERGEPAPISARGTTQYRKNTKIWVVLTDSYNNNYLQYPPIIINPNGSWRATNIRPLTDIILISFVKVDENGDRYFNEMKDRNEWGGFEILPTNSETVASIELL